MQGQSNFRMALLSGVSAIAVITSMSVSAQAKDLIRSGIETVTVTAERKKENLQSVPIAISAFSQKQLTDRQIAGGPDLVKEVPNLTFSKTNFTGYNLEIRGIGTQAISVTTDPAVSVALNGIPFIRNHFFEEKFFDLSNVEVLRGPQGTLWGRNAVAGVVNIITAKPVGHFEAEASAAFGNYNSRRYEGMINLPIVGSKFDIRMAGEWTKRDGYSFNTITNRPVDGRDLWSGRFSARFRPNNRFEADFVWEHFQESDDRLRSGKQLCHRDNGPTEIDGISTAGPGGEVGQSDFSQGCLPASLYSAASFQVPNGYSLPYFGGIIGAGFGQSLYIPILRTDPYASTTQSTNLRDIQSSINPSYRAKNDTLEFNAKWHAKSWLTVYSDTGYNRDFLWSTEDYNRFETKPDVFQYGVNQFGITPPLLSLTVPDGNYRCNDGSLSMGGNTCAYPGIATPTAYFCDPQLGCSTRLVGEDLSEEHSWQFSQELRLASDFNGPFNFSVGGNYLHYVTDENYYVFFNTLTLYSARQGLSGRTTPWIPGVSTNQQCLNNGYQLTNPQIPSSAEGCLGYIDPNPLTSLNNQGHNYFLSQNPYSLNSYAAFGEAYYNILPDLKFTGGLRWTDDQKRFVEIPSELLTSGYGYPTTGNINQNWNEWTGRSVLTWTPKLPFTDQSMFYASYAHGYKAGGANPPGAVLLTFGQGDVTTPTHPKTFKPEHIEAFELGTKNALLGGNLVLNGDVFYYNYHGYQISQIVDRTSVNLNFNATVEGAEVQTTWAPLPGLTLGFNGGYEATRLDKNQYAIDLMDRTAGTPNWYVVKPDVTQSSNCVLPAYVLAYQLQNNPYGIVNDCGVAYNQGLDPGTGLPYVPNPTPGYPGFNPATAPNNGEGFAKNIGGKELPNAPHFTASLTAAYNMPVSPDWVATLHSDFYYQSDSWARVFNDVPYDRIHGYTNLNLALILSDDTGWQVMTYVKNVFDTTAITGDFLNSDDTGLTTNVFLTDPRLYGIRITKKFGEGNWDSGGGINFIPNFFADADGKRPPLWLEFGGDFNLLDDNWQKFSPPFATLMAKGLPNPVTAEKAPNAGFDWDAKVAYQPEDSDWVLKAGIRYGRSGRDKTLHKSLPAQTVVVTSVPHSGINFCNFAPSICGTRTAQTRDYVDARSSSSEQHAILDFTAGKDVGLGRFTEDGRSAISGGIRVAQFTTLAASELNSDPNYVFKAKYNTHDVYDATTKEKRHFQGIGPEVTWDASQPIVGNLDNGQVDIDWGVNWAVLFGRQKVNITQHTSDTHFPPTSARTVAYANTKTIKRSREVVIPNLGAYIGVSANYRNAKVKFGYRVDEFFDAMDGGQATQRNENRAFYGPYLAIKIGLGG